MTEKELRLAIREEIKNINESSGQKWATKFLQQKEFDNFMRDFTELFKTIIKIRLY